jgi:hypothetical protein
LSGKDGDWFGVGFDAEIMAATPYSILIDGQGGVHEYVVNALLKKAVSVRGMLGKRAYCCLPQ